MFHMVLISRKKKKDRDKQSCRVMRKLNSNMLIETIYVSETTDMKWVGARMKVGRKTGIKRNKLPYLF